MMNELENSLSEYQDRQFSNTEPFVIDNDESANKIIKNILQEQKQIEDAEELAEKEIDKIYAWEKSIKTKHQTKIENFKALLYPYITEKLKDKKEKTVSLPNGKVSFRKFTKYEHDEEKLLPWVEENAPKFVKIAKFLQWGELKKIIKPIDGKCVTTDGEVLPGVSVKEIEEIYVKGAGSDEQKRKYC